MARRRKSSMLVIWVLMCLNSPRDVRFRLERVAEFVQACGEAMRLAAGEEAEALDQAPASAAAQLGKLGGTARAWNLTA